MGVGGSSSKRKSFKKKSSKISSEARRRKKSRKNKSKKLRRRDDSLSSYSDDDSRSLISVSSSSHEDDYRSRRTRSRTRCDVKSSRKRARRRSSSQQSSEGSPRVRKRKGPKRNGNSVVRKKTQKKKPRRDASISSTSSDSRSCSTCRGGSSSNEQGEFGRSRDRSRENKKDKRGSGKARSETKKRSLRSSSCSRCSDSSRDCSKEKLAGENNSRRLRSVITVAKQPQEKEENQWDKDEHKEEFVYDHEDYPSCRSNDSNDGGSKRELAHHSHVASEKRRQVENVTGEEASVSDLRTIKPAETGKDGGSQYDGSNTHSGGVATNNRKKENESEVSVTIAGSDGDDLESILRQKALENLRKFRGGLQTNAKTPADQKNKSGIDLKQLSTARAEFVQIKSPMQDGASVEGEIRVGDQSSRPTLRRGSSHPARIEGKIHDGKYNGTEPGTAKESFVYPPHLAPNSGNPKEKYHTNARTVTTKSEPGRSALRQESLGTYSTLKQAPPSQASTNENLLVTKSIVNKGVAETSQTVSQSSGNKHNVGDGDACGSTAPEPSSCVKPISEEHSSKEQQEKAKDVSQFEQKTMSVMRGGEMVQVSYKVYIPKKAPALARRQLQR